MTKLYGVSIVLRWVSALLLSLITGLISAQEKPDSDVDFAGLYGDEDYVSIATGSVQPIAKAPAVASVITARQIKAMGARDIDQVLESVPGLHKIGRAHV